MSEEQKPELRGLVDDYLALKSAIDDVETQLAAAKEEQRGIVGQIFSHYGAGPHVLNGVNCTITVRDGKHYFRQVQVKE